MKTKLTYLIISFLLAACVSDDEFEIPSALNQEFEEPAIEGTKTTFKAVKERFDQSFGAVTFREDETIYIEGYVVSSDEKGNFFKELIIQNKLDDSSSNEDPRLGFRVDINQSGLFSTYEIGRKVFIKLAGLSVSKENGVLVIGKLINGELDRVPQQELENSIIRSTQVGTIIPKDISIAGVSESDLNTLVTLNNAQFATSEVGKTYAGEGDDQFDGERRLQQCADASTMIVSSSKFSDFVSEVIPSGKGTITAVLSRDFSDTKNVLQIRDTSDLIFNESRCDISQNLETTISLNEVVSKYNGSVIDFGLDNQITEGYVISTDEEKNFINSIVIQDKAENPTVGIPILVEGELLYQRFPLGGKIKLKLDQLALGNTKQGMLAIGILRNGFIDEIPLEQADQFLFRTEEEVTLIPTELTTMELAIPGSLIAINNLELVTEEQNSAYAFFSGTDDGERRLIHCDSFETISLRNSGESTFANLTFPSGNGQIRAVVLEDEEGRFLKIREIEDVTFSNPYQNCTPTSSSNAIIFSELADPNNNDGARFIELYNASDEAVNITGWKLRRYTNESTTVSVEEELEGILFPNTTLVISPNKAVFESVYGFSPDLIPSNTTLADSNGDDNYELVDAEENIIDVFGVVGEDGTGTNHEFEDGRAFRKLSVTFGNPKYDFSEWQIWNDTGAAGTVLEVRDAPGGFSPGEREE
ncbi:DUF5689 domain-containing protein [Spongiivirga citrea]|uniref:LTD domain-containing protein n=1 Tax=Spongiivirga citrea TaxID=1481457 RepID=A0A6M0CGX8_9FLAO|nr:DUF5689 domain-containing protein [Spongiivirga citrea]NER17141.1 hypothetical protein [Spongiivirga citrea]